MLFKHEPKLGACHSYVTEIMFYQHSQIHSRKLSFCRRHCFVVLNFGDKEMNKSVYS